MPQRQRSAGLRKPVVMVGMMGAGKSSVGRVLAQELAVPFRDSDAEIEQAAAMSIAEIFARYGEAFFRDREAKVIARLLDGTPLVLALGGGAFLHPETRALVAEKATSVWLDVDLDTLWARVSRKTTRPLLQTADPFLTLKTLLEARKPIYSTADIRLAVRPEASVAETAEQVLKALAARDDVLTPI